MAPVPFPRWLVGFVRSWILSIVLTILSFGMLGVSIASAISYNYDVAGEDFGMECSFAMKRW